MVALKVTISLPQHLLTTVDNIARGRGIPRSNVITEMLREQVDRLEEQSMRDGYLALAKENRGFARESLPLAGEVLPKWE